MMLEKIKRYFAPGVRTDRDYLLRVNRTYGLSIALFVFITLALKLFTHTPAWIYGYLIGGIVAYVAVYWLINWYYRRFPEKLHAKRLQLFDERAKELSVKGNQIGGSVSFVLFSLATLAIQYIDSVSIIRQLLLITMAGSGMLHLWIRYRVMK